MPEKYHQSPDGRLLPCEASKRACPCGAHFTEAAVGRISRGDPESHAELSAWFTMRVNQESRAVAPTSKRMGWGYADDYMQAVLWAERFKRFEVVELLHRLRAQYGNPRAGGFRAVFDRGDGYVIKVPTTAAAQRMGQVEVDYYTSPRGEIRMAECWEEQLGDVTVLIAEKVRPLTGKELLALELPSWVWSIDNRQVGYSRSGELVAYDL